MDLERLKLAKSVKPKKGREKVGYFVIVISQFSQGCRPSY